MKADTYDLKGILGKERVFIVPTFQRDYEWTREGQWELLFDDLDGLADRLYVARLHGGGTGSSPKSSPEKLVAPHFLGAIVCDLVPTTTGDIDTRAVIDGQQRLTTLQLLLRGLLDVLHENGSPRAARVRRLLMNPDDVVSAEHPEHLHKLWPRRKDRDVWPVAMSDEPPPQAVSDHPYLEARRFFADRIRAAQENLDGTNKLDEITDALLDLFKIVVIDLEENDDAQIIFEVLNGRQTPLSASDLVKNLLFLRAERALEDVEALYNRCWSEFDEKWWKVSAGTGHAARQRRDTLLSVWLTAASGDSASVAHLYGEARRYLDAADRKPKDVIGEIHQYALYYRAIYEETAYASARVRDAYRRLIGLDLTTAMPLLVWMTTLPPETLSAADHERAVLAVESWVVRRMLRGANTRGYNLAFLSVLRSAQAAQRAGADIADAMISALDTDSRALGWPNDAELAEIFGTKQLYGVLRAERLRMVLAAIDDALQGRNRKEPDSTITYDNLQIEHIMPQQWRQQWPLGTEASLEAERLRDVVLHTAGNLTLVTPSFNASVSNGPWSAKRPEFTKQAKLEINRSLGESEEWDEQRIAERAAQMAAIATDIWLPPARLKSCGQDVGSAGGTGDI
jgi:hypothetical protein